MNGFYMGCESMSILLGRDGLPAVNLAIAAKTPTHVE